VSSDPTNPEVPDSKTDSAVDAPPPESSAPPAAPNKVARITRVVLSLCALFLIWYLIADRLTPSTSQARVRGMIVPVVPEISGVIQEVLVGVNDIVTGGQPLLRIDATDYEFSVRAAEADLEQAGQDVGAQTADVAGAQAELANARVLAQNVEVDAARVFSLGERRLIPQADVDHARTRLDEARGDVATAEANLRRATAQLGSEGENNPRVRAALAALEDARLDLARTVVHSPTSGVVGTLRVTSGYYASAGQPLLSFVSAEDVWIEAYMRENNIGNISIGDPAEIVLDVAPGRIFAGEVASVGFGINTGQDVAIGALPTVSPAAGWLREPQRFPVVIRFAGDESRGLRREGGQSDVIVYTGNNWIINALGWVSIRVQALLSYFY